MNKHLAPLVLIGLGIIVIIVGQRRANSIAGVSETVGAKIANAWDGDARQPDHVWYYVGGGALLLAGVAVALRKKSGT